MQCPQLCLWSKLIHSGRYDDYDTPPNIPLITGAPAPIKPKKQNVTEALAGVATAIAKALNSSPGKSGRVSQISDEEGTRRISPLKVTTIRRNCLDDLKRLKDLLEDDILTEKEYEEEKKQILATLKILR